MNRHFDVIVIGGGHAGAEASRAAARRGLRVALVTMSRDAIARMSCNPAIGGLAKGHLVKEIDALGGLMAQATDQSAIQYKLLNRSKGPAVQGPRAQCDRDLYPRAVQSILGREANITIIEGSATRLISSGTSAVRGVLLDGNEELLAKATIVTSGTFLRGLMHFGEEKKVGGRFDEPSAETLSDSLRELGLKLGRLKTGTPPRVHRDSLDLSRMEEQPGDRTPRTFSIDTDGVRLPQVLCWLTRTTELTHSLIRENLHRAPMYSGQIEGVGPRYCPSIEDKVVRFADKAHHHVFVEPEGLSTDWIYLNGISTSLPTDVQERVVRSITGLENAAIARFGYAVEYDFVNPQQLLPTLQVRGVQGLFLAGQINGTSGYEEAAAQGLIAGINAAASVLRESEFILRRDQAYIGVLIDDLVTLGTEEPYRMFTSRAEHRLLLGCDSVYERLTPLGAKLGIVSADRLQRAEARTSRMRAVQEQLESTDVNPDAPTRLWSEAFGAAVTSPTSAAKLLTRMALEGIHVDADGAPGPELAAALGSFLELNEEEREGVVSRIRYAGYLDKQEREAARLRQDDHARIPVGFSFERPGFSREVQEKLDRIRPHSLGQASRIPGVTPAAVSLLRMYLRQEASGGRTTDRASESLS